MTAIPVAKQALLNLITPLDSNLEVRWGWPAQLAEREYVWLDDAISTDYESVGMVSHRERFTIPIVIHVQADGDDHAAAETRAWQIQSAIETAIRSNPSLNAALPVLQAIVIAKTPVSGILDGARVISIVMDVQVESRY